MFERPPAAGDAEFPGVLVLLPSEVIRRIRQADGLPRRPARVPIGATDCAVGTSLASVGGPLGRIDWEQREMAPGMRAEWAETSRNDRDSYVGRHGPRLAEKALSRGTRSVYGRAVASFDDWRGARPATDASLADYLGVLFDRGMAPATASVVVAAVVEAAGDGSPPRGELTDRALAGFRRDGAGRGSGQVDGLSWEQVDHMAALAERSANRAAGLRDALLLRVASDCLLRVAEAAALDVADIAFEEDWLRVVVRRSKTDQEGKGAVLYAGAPTARLARMWLATAGIEEGPLFRAVNKAGRVSATRLSARSTRDIVRRRAITAGIDGRISGHSLRVGAAQSLRDAGATMPELLTAGRWKRVETMAQYTSAQEAAVGPVARLRYGVEPPDGYKPRRSWRAGLRRSSATLRRSPEASGESKRMGRAARRARKAAKRVEKNACAGRRERVRFRKSGFVEPSATLCFTYPFFVSRTHSTARLAPQGASACARRRVLSGVPPAWFAPGRTLRE